MNNENQPANIFAMFQRNPNCHYPCVRIDFTQIKDNYESALKGENVFKQIIPSYNNDKLYFTDAFVLESQIGRKTHTATECFSSEPTEECKEKFESRVQKQSENMEIQEIYQAEPDSFFCQICRTPFENYQQHIQHRDHVRNLEFSKGFKFIKEIMKQAQKHLSLNGTDQESKPKNSQEKTKLIRSKKGVAANTKKIKKDSTKKASQEGSSKIEPFQSEMSESRQIQKGEENKEFQSIIKGQMKYSAVEQPKIQAFN